jgi:hypothetical protein
VRLHELGKLGPINASIAVLLERGVEEGTKGETMEIYFLLLLPDIDSGGELVLIQTSTPVTHSLIHSFTHSLIHSVAR